jgi:hypothetical protein
MCGKDEQQLDVFLHISPSNEFRKTTNCVRCALSPMRRRENCNHGFKLYAKTEQPSIAPEKLLRALLLRALYSVRSERM